MPLPNKKKGIYCLEAPWDHDDILDKKTVLPILNLLEKCDICNHVYHDCATKSELEFYIDKWKNPKINDEYPILYLAFHGEKKCIHLNDKEIYSLDDLTVLLESKCIGKVIYFGSCSTLNIDKRIIKTFLKKTGAIATIGYKADINWIKSSACDLFVFEALQYDKLDSKGITKIKETIISDYGNLHKILDLRIEINDMQHFPRRRK